MRHRSSYTRLSYAGPIITLIAFTAAAFTLDGCLLMDSRYQALMDSLENAKSTSTDQGGYEGTILDLPFSEGYESLCTQGTNDTPTHMGQSTIEDLDFDTPNGQADLVYAPIGGTAHVHMESSSRNFGYHVNIDLGDGTYVVVAHMADVFIADGAEVAAGEILGYEGCTGKCDGDHVHIGVHDGDAGLMAEYGDSIEVAYFVDDVSTGEVGIELAADDFVCGLDGSGDTYRSLLPITYWHPNGTLIMTPDDNNVYLLQDGKRRWIETQDVFWALGYSFDQVVLVSPEELACYDVGETIDSASDVRFAIDNVFFRDGDLVKEVSRSDVYVISDGMAMPIQTWEIYLRLGFGQRTVKTIDDGTILSYGVPAGNCAAGYACIDTNVIETCGGSVAGTGGADNGGQDTTGNENNTDTGSSGNVEEEVNDTGTNTDPSTVEICYLPGETMADGELYLDGIAFTYWVSPVADTAKSGDTDMCATVTANPHETVKLNAWYQTSAGSETYWAAYNNWCKSIDFRGSVQVNGMTVPVTTAPWSAAVWASDPCSIGGDGYIEIP